MKLRLDKPWRDLTPASVAALPGQLGVYQLAGADGQVTKIGYAGARELFGLRSALQRELDGEAGQKFRYEVNTQYSTRWRELLMLHAADFGAVPAANAADARRLGRLG